LNSDYPEKAWIKSQSFLVVLATVSSARNYAVKEAYHVILPCAGYFAYPPGKRGLSCYFSLSHNYLGAA
jgi:hypothetical protein